MSATVDSLSIKVDASARGANQQLDKLVQKMIQLRSAVNGINVGNLNTMAASIQNFSKAAAGLNQVKTSDFTRMAKSIEKLSNIRKGELNRAATAITNISKAFSNIGNVSDGAEKIAQLAQGISRLGYKSTTQAIQNIPLLTKELKNMMTELSKAPTVSSNIIAMTNAMANLGAQASGIRSLGSAMNGAGRSGNGFFGTMKKGISNIKSFASNIRSATTHNRSFASTIGLLYAKFWTLRRAMGALGNAIKSSMDYIEEYNYFNVTMEKIASEWSDDFKKYGYENGDAYGKSFQNRVTEIMNKMTGFKMNDDGTLTDSGIKNLGLDVTQMTNYAAGVAQVTNSVGLTGEASIVTSKALSMLAGDMSSFRNLDMQTVMTNFSSGLIGQSRALYKYGIDITNATLATYAHELGIKKDISAMTQGEKMQLRMIAILDQSKVAWGDLAKTINSPSNQLRLLRNNFNALARTIGNIFLPVVTKVLPYVNGLVIAIRRLFEWTASMLGIDLKDVIGNSGGGYSDMFDGLEEDADNAGSSISNIGDSADKSTESVKKLAKQLMGFDELNVINTTESFSGKNGSDGESGAGGTIDLTDQLSAALADYEKVWNDAYKNMTNDAEKFADKLTKLFKDAWKSGDGSDIGSAIAGWLNKGLKWVNENWSIADEKIQKIANILATAVNGFTYEFDWSGLGTALSNTLQTWLDGKTTFFDNTDWSALGTGIATSLNSFIGDGGNGPIQSYLKNLGSMFRSAIEFAFGAVTTFDFKNLGTAIGRGINDFFDKMGKVDKKTGLNGWQELAVTISEGIKGIATTITTALETVEWEEVGQAIADFITGIKWKDVFWELGNVVQSFADALKRTLKGGGMNDTLANLIVNVGIGGWIIKKLSKTKLGKAILKKLGSKFSTTLKKVGASIKDWIVNSWNKSKLKSKIENKISGIKAAIKKVGASIKDWAVKNWNKSKLKSKIENKISGIKVAIKNAGASVKNWIAKSWNKSGLISKLSSKATNITVPITGVKANISWGGVLGFAGIAALLGVEAGKLNDDFESVGNDIGTQIKNGIIDAVKFLTFYDLVSAINDGLNGNGSSEQAVKDILQGADNALTKLQNAFNNFMTGGEGGTPTLNTGSNKEDADHSNTWWGEQKDKVLNIGMSITEDSKDLWRDIKSLWFGAGDKIANLKADVKASIASGTQKVLDWWDGVKEKSKELVVKAKGKMDSAFDKVKSAWSNFKTGTKEVWAKAKGEVNKKFEDIKEAWSNFKSGTKELYAKAKGKIEETFESVKSTWENIKSETKDILVNAKGKVDETFQDVKEVWKDTKEGVKNLVLKARGEIKDSVDKIIGKWEDVKDKTVEMIASASKGELFKSIFESSSSAWNAIRSKTVILSAKAREIGASIFDRIKRKWSEISTKSATLTATFKDFFTAPLKRAWNGIANTINKAIKIINKIPGVEISNSLPLLAKGGIYSGGSWHNIAKYADGGLPSMGQMFVAREAGPELVGTIGGHTAVMNNNQIVASVSDGVFNALAPVLTSLVNSINTMSAKMDNIGSGGVGVEKYTEGDLLKVIRKEDNNYRKRTGKSAFAL